MRRFRILTITVGLGGFGMAAGGANCNPVSDFQCSTSEDCIAQGEGGVCEANSFCTFPDTTCDSGKRWHDRASSLAGMCFGEGSGTATDTDDPTTGTVTTEDTTTGGESSDSSSSTGDPTTGDPPTTGEPTTGDPMTTGGSSSSGGPATCDEMYGGAMDYMLCEEAADSCRFNVTIAMTANCTMVCESFGGSCIGAQLNDADPCLSTGDTTCEDMAVNDLMCICSR